LNSSAYGLTSANALTIDIYAIYNNAAGGVGVDRTVKLTASIKDCACCGAPTNTGGWLTLLCHNLGANESADPFNWTRNSANDANGSIDIKGDLYQWGRPKDGHEKRNSGTTSTKANSNTPGHANFITIGMSVFPSDWRNGSGQLSRWGDGTENMNMPKAANDPCPAGWKVPSQKQWISIYTARESGATSTVQSDGTMSWLWTGNGYKIGNNLFLPAAGYRYCGTGSITSVGSTGMYWSSTIRWETNEYMCREVYFTETFVMTEGYARDHPADGNSVRCTPE
jgi:Fibrobacter succinogenes major domain (Fib_succ_major).